MRKSPSPPEASLSEGTQEEQRHLQAEQGRGGRVFGVALEELQTSGQPGHQVPLLIASIVAYVEQHGQLDMEGVFLVNGNAERVDWLRRRYDNGEHVELQREADLPSAISLLRLFLQEMPRPLIPSHLHSHIRQIYQESSSASVICAGLKDCISQMPQLHSSLLRFLCRFLVGVSNLHLGGVSNRQEEGWTLSALANVFGPDIFHWSAEQQDSQVEECVHRVLLDLLQNREEIWGLEEDDEDEEEDDEDVSTTNDYSSVNEQVTELAEEDGVGGCEELPTDGDDVFPQTHLGTHCSQDSPPSSSHISSINILPGSAEIIQRTIRAAVEQHFLDLKSFENSSSHTTQSLSEYDPNEKDGLEGEDTSSPSLLDTPSIEDTQHQASGEDVPPSGSLEESSGMELDAESLVATENIINTTRQDSQQMEHTDLISCEEDVNGNPEHTHLQLSNIFPQGEWEDPVPASKVWQQEDGDAGEAQLSPLASRMLPLPLEEDAPPLLARRFLDFGHSQRFFQQEAPNTSPTKALSAGRQRRASFSTRESVKGDGVSVQLTKKLQNLKKKIRQFEEQFERERNYKPSHGDKAANPKVLKWMTDLTKIRKQIKDARQRVESELTPLVRPRSNTLPRSFGSSLDPSCPIGGLASTSTAPPEGLEANPQQQQPSQCPPQANPRQDTLDLIQQRLKARRQEEGWPHDVKKMSKEQLAGEKTALQKNLLHYEGLYGRPVTREERLIVKPLYDRYRLIKQMLTRVSITPIVVSPTSKRRNQTLQPIIEGETAHFCDEIQEEEEEEEEQKRQEGEEHNEEGGGAIRDASGDVTISLDPAAQPPSHQPLQQAPPDMRSAKMAHDLRLSSTHATSMPELLEQLWKARAEKKRLRRTIREFEDDFYQQNGRTALKEDRVPLLDEYKEYKRVKAKLRLLEVLISKQDSSKSI